MEFVDVPEEETGKNLCPPDNVTTCPTYQDGDFCPRQQPAWSAYRCAYPNSLTPTLPPSKFSNPTNCRGACSGRPEKQP